MNKVGALDLKDCRTQLMWANERILDAEVLHMRSSFTEITVCWLVLSGALRFEAEHESVEVSEGEWVFPAAVNGVQHFSEGTRLISIRFLLNLPGGRRLFSRQRSLQFKADRFPGLDRAARALVKGLEPWSERESLIVGRDRIPLNDNFQIEALFYQWLAAYIQTMHGLGEMMQLREQGDLRVAEALRRLDRFVFREGFSEGELAEKCGLSVNQLALLFKGETGLTPFQYYDRLRLERARLLLVDTDLQVKEVAFELGFSSSPHFTNWFKQREGEGPRAFRLGAEGGL
ncbi:AraC family transcriptional regulator [Kiritimatiellota bacterium B12222]|nr:AraC family transcriptional regulator [Kiritimatiellota bacterium B12222]